jgi:hypothetical protein
MALVFQHLSPIYHSALLLPHLVPNETDLAETKDHRSSVIDPSTLRPTRYADVELPERSTSPPPIVKSILYSRQKGARKIQKATR